MSIKIFWCEWDGKTDSHELLREAVGRYLNRELEGLAVEYEENGKPKLRDWPRVYFSISHSENIWSCAVGDCPLGLDLQKQYEKMGRNWPGAFFIRKKWRGWRFMVSGSSAAYGLIKKVM